MLKPAKNEIRKPTKTISGITPVAIMLPPRKCAHGCCIYCPNLNVPQSYTPKSPVVLRAKELNYDSFQQVQARLEAFKVMNHPTDKIEIIIMGGTFLQYPEKFQNDFIKGIYDALNNKKSKTIEQAQKLNEKSKHRCVALCVETRPDVCVKFIDRMRKWGVTRVELGVQIIDDKIYKLVKRGHSVKDVIDATRALRDAGFKIGYHIMPGLPGSNLKKDLQLFKKLFSDSKFKPDQLKVYPCQVMPCSELEEMYWNKKYKPYTKEETEKILIAMLKSVPRYCRVMRIMREIHPDYIVAGTKKIDLRADIEKELKKKNSKIKEIRYREIGFALRDENNPSSAPRQATLRLPPLQKYDSSTHPNINKNLRLKITKYQASQGNEYFLEFVNKDNILFGLLRLRIFKESIIIPLTPPNFPLFRSDLMTSKLTSSNFSDKKIVSPVKNFRNNINDISTKNKVNDTKNEMINNKRGYQYQPQAIIREVHVYGKSLELHKREGQANETVGVVAQHLGLGKELMKKAEEIAKKEKCKKIKIISGIGVRKYYKNLGYDLENTYMVKYL